MTTRTELLALADRVESLTGPQYATEVQIENMLGIAKFDRDPMIGWGDADYHRRPPKNYTASIDAAMLLVPEGWWLAGMHFCPVDFRSEHDSEYHAEIAGPISWGVIEHGCPEEPLYDCEGGNAATPALALCAAALRALANGAEHD